MSCENACIDSEGFTIHKTFVNDIANQPLIDENGLSVENPSEPSTHLLQDEEDCDGDGETYDSRDDNEDCDEDDNPPEYVVDTSKDDDEDCDNELERLSPYATNASSKPAAQVPTSPFVTGSSEDGARPTVTGTATSWYLYFCLHTQKVYL